jgi:PHD/YefM family antitoxin component YafN of YafNO toxin-antitoxin module
MVSTNNTQSLTDFRQKATQTLDRINRTGEAEIITVNGQARAVLLSPAAFDEMNREAISVQDAAAIVRSIKESSEGKGRDAAEFFDEVRARLIAMKSQKSRREGRR